MDLFTLLTEEFYSYVVLLFPVHLPINLFESFFRLVIHTRGGRIRFFITPFFIRPAAHYKC